MSLETLEARCHQTSGVLGAKRWKLENFKVFVPFPRTSQGVAPLAAYRARPPPTAGAPRTSPDSTLQLSSFQMAPKKAAKVPKAGGLHSITSELNSRTIVTRRSR